VRTELLTKLRCVFGHNWMYSNMVNYGNNFSKTNIKALSRRVCARCQRKERCTAEVKTPVPPATKPKIVKKSQKTAELRQKQWTYQIPIQLQTN